MASFTVHKGKRYQAILKLSFLQQVASNEMVAGKFREVGFEDVEAGGSGRKRVVRGSWLHDDNSAEIPREVISIKEVSVIEA